MAPSVVSQFRLILIPSTRPVRSSLRMKLVVRPLILAASVTEMRSSVRLSSGVCLVAFLVTAFTVFDCV